MRASPPSGEAHAIPAHSNSRNLPLPAGNHLSAAPTRSTTPSQRSSARCRSAQPCQA